MKCEGRALELRIFTPLFTPRLRASQDHSEIREVLRTGAVSVRTEQGFHPEQENGGLLLPSNTSTLDFYRLPLGSIS